MTRQTGGSVGADRDFAPDRARIDAVLRAAVDRGAVPGVVAAVTDRRGIVYEGAAGRMAADGTPMRTDTIFRVASMTKPVTAAAVMMLCEQGRLELDDPLARHLPGFEQPGVLVSFDEETAAYTVRDAARAVTLRDMLTHTSGFGYWFLHREILREANGRVNLFGAPFLMHDPGERFTYGISTDILGLIVEPVSGVPLDRFIEERISAPLGMHSTGFALPQDTSRLATLGRRSGGEVIDVPKEEFAEPPRGGGGLYTTASDYLAFLRMLLNGGTCDDGTRLLTAQSVDAMTSNQIGELDAERQQSAFTGRTLDFAFMDGSQKFGFNLLIETRDRAEGRHAGSYGWGGIFNTYFWVDPAAGVAAVMMMQLSPFCDPDCLALRLEVERAVYGAQPPRPLRQLQ